VAISEPDQYLYGFYWQSSCSAIFEGYIWLDFALGGEATFTHSPINNYIFLATLLCYVQAVKKKKYHFQTKDKITDLTPKTQFGKMQNMQYVILEISKEKISRL
jgi:hypothetical protein